MLLVARVWAAETQGDLLIRVLRADNDKPIVQAVVRLQDKGGRSPIEEKRTDGSGQIRFTNLELGEYYLEISHPDYEGDRSLVKITGGAEASYFTLLDARGQEKVIRFKEDLLLVNGKDPNDGAVARRNEDFVKNQLADRSLPAILATVPGTANNSVGQVHVRGDHRAINFSLDGVTLPIAPSSSTTPPIDPDFIDQLELRTGNYDGSQSGAGGMVLNGLTDWRAKEPFFELRPTVGTQGTQQIMLKLGGSNEDQSFNYLIAAKTGTTDMKFEPPSPNDQLLNNKGQNTNVLARFRLHDETNDWGLTLSHQTGLYGVSQTPQNFGAGVRQTQEDLNTFLLGSWKRRIDEDSDLNMSLAYYRSRQTVNNNGVFTGYQVFNPALNPELSEEGLPADPTNPGSPYLPNTLTEFRQFQPAFQYTHRTGDNQRIVVGGNANFIHSRQDIDILDAGGGGALPDQALRFQANVARAGFSGGLFFSHTLPIVDELMLNYGVRLDRFNDGIAVNTGQISPFANLAYSPTAQDVFRLSYHRLFQAPPLELDLGFTTSVLPQRVHLYEASFEHQFDGGVTAKLAALHKSYRDQVDTGQLISLSNIPLYAPVNFSRASYDGIEFSLNTHNKSGWNGFLGANLSWARPLEAGPAGILTEFNDHDQRLQLTAGASHTWDNGLTVASDIFYGSGFPQDALGLYNAQGIFPYGLNQQRVPRFLANLSVNYWPAREANSVEYGGSLQVINLFDQRNLINFFSDFSGTRFNQQRRILLNGMVRF